MSETDDEKYFQCVRELCVNIMSLVEAEQPSLIMGYQALSIALVETIFKFDNRSWAINNFLELIEEKFNSDSLTHEDNSNG